MPGRLRRFLNLERRRALPTPQEPTSDVDRLPDAGTAAALLREQRRAQLENDLALDPPDEAQQPFTRCGQCETDNSRFATRCTTCGQELHTQEQEAFNREFWKERRAQQAEERLEQARLELQLRTTEAPAGPPAEEGLAPLYEWPFAPWIFGGHEVTPPLLRLLRRIDSPGPRRALAASLLALWCGLGINLLRSWPHPSWLVAALLFAETILLLPQGQRDRT